jgi:hypothetical protein
LGLLSGTGGDFARKCPSVALDDGDASCPRTLTEHAGEESREIAAGRSREVHGPPKALAHDRIRRATMVPQHLLVRFRERYCRVYQAAAVGSDQEIHSIDGDEPFGQMLYIIAAAVIIIGDELEWNRMTELRNEEAAPRISLLNPQMQPLERLYSLQRVKTGL